MTLDIRHIEILVSDLKKSVDFYSRFFSLIGWEKVDTTGFQFDGTKIYLKESESPKRNLKSKQKDILGPRHMCFNASNTEMVNTVGKFLKEHETKIIRGPLEVFDDWHPNGGYYTIDFYDPDGYILEVACKK